MYVISTPAHVYIVDLGGSTLYTDVCCVWSDVFLDSGLCVRVCVYVVSTGVDYCKVHFPV